MLTLGEHAFPAGVFLWCCSFPDEGIPLADSYGNDKNTGGVLVMFFSRAQEWRPTQYSSPRSVSGLGVDIYVG
jgi:hypothetical protein